MSRLIAIDPVEVIVGVGSFEEHGYVVVFRALVVERIGFHRDYLAFGGEPFLQLRADQVGRFYPPGVSGYHGFASVWFGYYLWRTGYTRNAQPVNDAFHEWKIDKPRRRHPKHRHRGEWDGPLAPALFAVSFLGDAALLRRGHY